MGEGGQGGEGSRSGVGHLYVAIALALFLLGPGAPLEASSGRPEIRLAKGDSGFEVLHLAPEILEHLRNQELPYERWIEIFPVVAGAPEPGRPAMWGSYSVEADRVRFTPRFPLAPGQAYSADWLGGSGELACEPVAASFRLPPSAGPSTTEVLAVYPSAGELPENLLKLYLQFSAPISCGEALRHLHLVTTGGEEVLAPFAAPEHELWNPSHDRLTVFFDPGRIKRGVGPNETFGPTLRAGESYRLVIDHQWRDAGGRPLKLGFEKHFRVVAADRSQTRPEDWRLEAPAGSRGVLVLSFPEPLDHALLQRLLVVVDGEGHRLEDNVTVDDRERRWSFRPADPWRPGSYEIRVDAALEDLAGNSLRRSFETAIVGAPAPAPAEEPVVRLPFAVPEP